MSDLSSIGKFNVIYADPPWPVKKIVRKSRPNQKQMDYQTMSLDEIKNLDVKSCAEDNCCLFLWTTHAFLPHTFDVMQRWGFKYQRTITWDKANGMCLFGFHHRTEFLLFGYKGKIEMYPKRKAMPTLLTGKSDRHSEKPSSIRDLVSTFGDKRLELFSRHQVDGWTMWGNQVGLLS